MNAKNLGQTKILVIFVSRKLKSGHLQEWRVIIPVSSVSLVHGIPLSAKQEIHSHLQSVRISQLHSYYLHCHLRWEMARGTVMSNWTISVNAVSSGRRVEATENWTNTHGPGTRTRLSRSLGARPNNQAGRGQGPMSAIARW